MPPATSNRGRELSRTPCAAEGLSHLEAVVYAVPHRSTGRRVVILAAGSEVFDTDDCYDIANAFAKAEDWLNQNLDRLKRIGLEAKSPAGDALGDCHSCAQSLTTFDGAFYAPGVLLCIPCAAKGEADKVLARLKDAYAAAMIAARERRAK
jgi:hypothetical protein